ncbi:MAG: DUF4384 domain-containing protein [Gemmataceae bacterium]|nr:DUF4384 domain-containing protein [Gemmataceae bacterium]
MNACLLAACLLGADAEKPLQADLSVKVWSVKDDDRRGIDLFDKRAMPLREDELIQVHVKLNRKAHFYILWIDGQGKVDAFHPWDREDDQLAAKPIPPTKPTKALSLPPAADQGYPMDGPSGLETILLLAREKPLPKGFKLEALGEDLGASKLRETDEAVRLVLHKGVWQEKQFRCIGRKEDEASEKIDAPLKKLMERAGKHFDLVQAVRFAYKGER